MNNKVFLSVFLNLIFIIIGDATTGGTGSLFENLPAVAMDYKVHIDAGKEARKNAKKFAVDRTNVFIEIGLIYPRNIPF
jgi:hypothetical protein